MKPTTLPEHRGPFRNHLRKGPQVVVLFVVPGAGLEPARGYPQRFLRPAASTGNGVFTGLWSVFVVTKGAKSDPADPGFVTVASLDAGGLGADQNLPPSLSSAVPGCDPHGHQAGGPRAAWTPSLPSVGGGVRHGLSPSSRSRMFLSLIRRQGARQGSRSRCRWRSNIGASKPRRSGTLPHSARLVLPYHSRRRSPAKVTSRRSPPARLRPRGNRRLCSSPCDFLGPRGAGLDRSLPGSGLPGTPATECSPTGIRCCCSGWTGCCCCGWPTGHCSHCCSTSRPATPDST